MPVYLVKWKKVYRNEVKDMGDFLPNEEDTVTLSLDDGTELECAVLAVFPAGDRDYIALLPLDEEEGEEGEVFLYRFSEDEDGEIALDNIEDDEEYEQVADAFDELLDSEEFDELFDED